MADGPSRDDNTAPIESDDAGPQVGPAGTADRVSPRLGHESARGARGSSPDGYCGTLSVGGPPDVGHPRSWLVYRRPERLRSVVAAASASSIALAVDLASEQCVDDDIAPPPSSEAGLSKNTFALEPALLK